MLWLKEKKDLIKKETIAVTRFKSCFGEDPVEKNDFDNHHSVTIENKDTLKVSVYLNIVKYSRFL